MNVLYLALSTARARQVRYDTDFLVARGVTVDLLTASGDDWTPRRLDRRVRVRTYAPLPAVQPLAVRLARRLPRGRTRVLRWLSTMQTPQLRMGLLAQFPAPLGSCPVPPGEDAAAPVLVVIGGAASLPLAHRLADAYPGLQLTFELDWTDPAFAELPVLDTTVDPRGALR